MLARVAQAMKPCARLCIMELFWDAQKFEAASFSLNATSLYFTCMANGNSRFYSVEKFYRHRRAQVSALNSGWTTLGSVIPC